MSQKTAKAKRKNQPKPDDELSLTLERHQVQFLVQLCVGANLQGPKGQLKESIKKIDAIEEVLNASLETNYNQTNEKAEDNSE